ncbi:hypothetical protein TSUD_321030 [Trifolium subterraneum]|uniref:SWIM-type domain-containing protein n=1 Tax=Trifolium subterraneum TaxID=3900 RepID=A0A2Z6P7E9_TRISU|nr:hypothetical protein TSUD_321030 [Trifolium subterraneum]
MPQRRLEKEVSMTGYWQPTWVIHEEFQVAHQFNGQQFIVNTAKKTCTCNFWELVGIPCRHVVTAISYQGNDPLDYVDDCYSREKYAACYGFAISAINGVDMWPKPPDGVEENILPPLYKKGPGRPRKLRIREFDEAGVRKPRKGKYHCTTCGHPGHNAGSCKLPQDPNALNRKRKPSNGKASVSQPPASASQPSAVASQTPAVASQVVEASQDLFGDIPDEVIASIPDVKVIDKKLPVKSNKRKGDHHQPLYHEMKRRTSERIKTNSLQNTCDWCWFKSDTTYSDQ